MAYSYSICNIDYDNQLNKRITERHFPTSQLKPNLPPIPNATKYQKFPILADNYKKPEDNYVYFNPKSTFYPGTSKGPVSFALDNVDVESKLRNQFFALQKNVQSYYIPPTHSTLYQMNSNLKPIPTKLDLNMKVKQPHHDRDRCNLAPDTFNNSTRYNLKNMK